MGGMLKYIGWSQKEKMGLNIGDNREKLFFFEKKKFWKKNWKKTFRKSNGMLDKKKIDGKWRKCREKRIKRMERRRRKSKASEKDRGNKTGVWERKIQKLKETEIKIGRDTGREIETGTKETQQRQRERDTRRDRERERYKDRHREGEIQRET
jgi:hypothetical protein